MVRELTKSALSFSWALSLLGVKQAINLGRPGQQGGDLLSPVTQAAVGQLDESLKNIYRSGENLQSRMVDMAFVSVNPSSWTSGRPMGNVTQAGSGATAQTRPQATGVVEAAFFWMNPFNWLTPENWNAMSSVRGCGQSGCGCSSQASSQTSGEASSGAGSQTGWGPMPGQTL